MKQEHDIFFNRNAGMWIIQEGETCDVCHSEIDKQGFYFSGWSNKNHDSVLFCRKCQHHYKKNIIRHHVESVMIVHIVKEIPKSAQMYIDRPPLLVDGRYNSTFDATKPDAGVITIDKTVVAGRGMDTLEGSTIGAPPSIMERQMHSMKQLGEEINKNLKAVFYNEDDEEVKKNECKRISEK